MYSQLLYCLIGTAISSSVEDNYKCRLDDIDKIKGTKTFLFFIFTFFKLIAK